MPTLDYTLEEAKATVEELVQKLYAYGNLLVNGEQAVVAVINEEIQTQLNFSITAHTASRLALYAGLAAEAGLLTYLGSGMLTGSLGLP